MYLQALDKEKQGTTWKSKTVLQEAMLEYAIENERIKRDGPLLHPLSPFFSIHLSHRLQNRIH